MKIGDSIPREDNIINTVKKNIMWTIHIFVFIYRNQQCEQLN
jgi:hypothetical protein